MLTTIQTINLSISIQILPSGMNEHIKYVITLDIRKNDYNSYYKISLLLHKLNKKEETIDMLTTLLKNKPQMLEASMLLRRNLSRRKRIQKGN